MIQKFNYHGNVTSHFSSLFVNYLRLSQNGHVSYHVNYTLFFASVISLIFKYETSLTFIHIEIKRKSIETKQNKKQGKRDEWITDG